MKQSFATRWYKRRGLNGKLNGKSAHQSDIKTIKQCDCITPARNQTCVNDFHAIIVNTYRHNNDKCAMRNSVNLVNRFSSVFPRNQLTH